MEAISHYWRSGKGITKALVSAAPARIKLLKILPILNATCKRQI